MRIALISLVALGCSKSEPEQAPAATATGSSTPAVASGSPARTLDCTTIVTPADFATACHASVEIEKDPYEAKTELTACSRMVKAAGKKLGIAQWSLATFADAASAEAWVKRDTGTPTPVAGVGDAAWTRSVEDKGLDRTELKAHVRKGSVVVTIGTWSGGSNASAPCTLEQLVDIARAAAPRLP